MLSELHIENIALIERADISFHNGMNVLTGETGAGKSIIIDSINAVLGNRTSRELVRTGASSALVTAVFITDEPLSWMRENDIPESNEIILQRRISSDGKTSCRVCGVPVTASQLRELASLLVDIHGQNDGTRLLDEREHLGYLDGFGDYSDVLEEYQRIYRTLIGIRKEIKTLTLDEYERERLSQSLHKQISEIESADIHVGELDSLRSRRDLLLNSEKLREALNGALVSLNSGEDGAVALTQNSLGFTRRCSELDPELNAAAKSLEDALFSLRNAEELLSDYSDSLDFSGEEYNTVEERIGKIERLCRKYTCDEKGLLELLDHSRAQLNNMSYSEERISALKKEFDSKKINCIEASSHLSEVRKKTAEYLESLVTAELKDLNMPSVIFKVDIQPLEKFGASGKDNIRFIMSANSGEAPGRIAKIASGGELSRIMLALKNVFAKNDSVGTMIFDEIDTGVSGIAAQRVAEKLYSVSEDRQVMCVTHLPQIASMADSQYRVSKSEQDGRTLTSVDELGMEERTREIARLYGGDNVSDITLAAAREQMERAEVYKKEGKQI